MAERIYDVGKIKELVAAKIKQEFPKYRFSLRIRRGGSGVIYITWLKGDFNPFVDTNETHLDINHYYIQDDKRITQKAKDVMQRVKDITDEYNWDNSDAMTDYFDVNFYLHLNIGSYDKPFEVVASANKPRPTQNSPSDVATPNFDKGKLLREGNGWKVYLKMLPDGRIVYNVFKDKETPANKSDWDAIKGEVYIESGFKWSKYGFSRWGSMTPNDENLILDALFKVLSKYYTETTPQKPTNNNNITLQDIKIFKEYVSSFYGKFGVYKKSYNGGFSEDAIDKAVDSYLLTTSYWAGGGSLDRDNVRDILISSTNSSQNYIYGEGFGVPYDYGQRLINELRNRGFQVVEHKKAIHISKPNYSQMTIYDNGGEFSVTIMDVNANPNVIQISSSIPYDKTTGIVDTFDLANDIESLYLSEVMKINTSDIQKQNIQITIKGLQYLADLGNEDAKATIIGLKYLL
jgi:hypothetical protein